MKVEVRKLNDSLREVVPVLQSRSVMPILEYVRIFTHKGRLYVQGTNLDVISTSCVDGVECDDELDICVSGHIISNMTGKLDGEIEIIHNGSIAKILADGSVFEMDAMNGTDYPIGDDFKADAGITLKLDEFDYAVTHSMVCMSNDEFKPELNEIKIVSNGDGSAHFMAGTGYILARVKVHCDGDSIDISLPSGAIKPIMSLLRTGHDLSNIEIQIGMNHGMIICGKSAVRFRLQDNVKNFPVKIVENALDGFKHTCRSVVDAGELRNAVELVQMFSEIHKSDVSEWREMDLSVEKALILKSREMASNKFAEKTIDIDEIDGTVSATYTPKDFLNALRKKSGPVELLFDESNKCVINCETCEFMLMPMKRL